jgi:hypothetical protein
LSALVIDDVGDAAEAVVVRARTRSEPVACPVGCHNCAHGSTLQFSGSVVIFMPPLVLADEAELSACLRDRDGLRT